MLQLEPNKLGGAVAVCPLVTTLLHFRRYMGAAQQQPLQPAPLPIYYQLDTHASNAFLPGDSSRQPQHSDPTAAQLQQPTMWTSPDPLPRCALLPRAAPGEAGWLVCVAAAACSTCASSSGSACSTSIACSC